MALVLSGRQEPLPDQALLVLPCLKGNIPNLRGSVGGFLVETLSVGFIFFPS